MICKLYLNKTIKKKKTFRKEKSTMWTADMRPHQAGRKGPPKRHTCHEHRMDQHKKH